MQVQALIDALKKMDPKAYVVINSTVVEAVEEVKGTIEHPIMSAPRFKMRERGKEKAVVFTHPVECSDGLFHQSRMWFGDPHD